MTKEEIFKSDVIDDMIMSILRADIVYLRGMLQDIEIVKDKIKYKGEEVASISQKVSYEEETRVASIYEGELKKVIGWKSRQ